ncbi:MAG: hypothetical protein NVSMB10_09020 [Steroidobacteraceae bacterium]
MQFVALFKFLAHAGCQLGNALPNFGQFGLRLRGLRIVPGGTRLCRERHRYEGGYQAIKAGGTRHLEVGD